VSPDQVRLSVLDLVPVRTGQSTSEALAASVSLAQVDSTGIERLERADLLGHDERRVVRQHDAARADPDGGRAAGDMSDDDGCRGAGDAGHVVMLGQPEAPVMPPLGMLREIERVAEGVGGVAALVDRRQVQY